MTRQSSSQSKSGVGRSKLPREAEHAPAVAALSAAPWQSVDESTGAAALKRVQPLLAALAPAEVVPPTLNLRTAALAVLGVYGLIEARGLRPRLEALARIGELDEAALQQLPDLARATYYARFQVEQGQALASAAMVPAVLAAHGQEQRRRMLKLVDFHMGEDPQVAPRIELIRRGSGYQDLAEDLLALVALYRQHRPILKQTPTHYHAGDEKDAARTAAELLAWLGGDAAGTAGSEELQRNGELSSRAGQLLVRAYDEVAAAARFLCRNEPALAARFQSLYTLTRARASAAAAPQPADLDPTPGDAEDTPATP